MLSLCPAHWKEIKDKVAEFGMDHLIKKTANEALADIRGQLEGAPAEQTFDPLMGAYWAIQTTYLRGAGLAAFQSGLCSLCDVDQESPGRATNWIEGSVTDQFNRAKHLGLIKCS